MCWPRPVWFFCRNLGSGSRWWFFRPRIQGFHSCLSCLQNHAEVQKLGLDDLPYECGSQRELYPPTHTSSMALLRLRGLRRMVSSPSAAGSPVCLKFCRSAARPCTLSSCYDDSVTTERDLVLEVQKTGLDVESVVLIRVEGMQCQCCVQTIEEHIGSLLGVSNISGSLQESAVIVTYRPLLVMQQELSDHIQDLGFSTWLLPDADLSLVWLVGSDRHSLHLWDDLQLLHQRHRGEDLTVGWSQVHHSVA